MLYLLLRERGDRTKLSALRGLFHAALESAQGGAQKKRRKKGTDTARPVRYTVYMYEVSYREGFVCIKGTDDGALVTSSVVRHLPNACRPL